MPDKNCKINAVKQLLSAFNCKKIATFMPFKKTERIKSKQSA